MPKLQHDHKRPVSARWTITATARLASAACIGGGRGEISDNPILQDAVTGRPLIPGSSIAGALRSYLKKIHVKDSLVDKAFGSDKASRDGDQSPLIVFDSISEGGSVAIELRDGVKIDGKTGIAADHAKYDYEVIPAGTVFPLRFDIIVPDPESEPAILSTVLTAMHCLEEQKISLGIKKTRGLGRLRVDNWAFDRYDMKNQKECLSWVLSDHQIKQAGNKVTKISDMKTNIQGLIGKPLDIPGQVALSGVSASLCFKLPYGILIRSESSESGAPDAVHLKSAGKPVVSGTSIAGALRHHAAKIAGNIRASQHDSEIWIDNIFGPDITRGNSKKPAASRLLVHESQIRDGEEIRVSRIQIDRFTQSVFPGALFDEQIHREGRFDLKLDFVSENKAEIGLFLLLIKDLVTGQITFGGTNSVGRGFVELDGQLENKLELNCNGGKVVKVFSDLSKMHSEDIKVIDEYIKAFKNSEKLNSDRGDKNEK